MTVTNDCSAMTTPNVNFNSAPVVQSFPTVSQAIAVTCTKGSSFMLSILWNLAAFIVARLYRAGRG
jgi:spore coat protein U-like protein